MFREGIFDHHRPMEGKVAVANASGVATTFYGPVPEGYAWYVERLSTHAPTTNTACSIFVSAEASTSDPGFRADFTAVADDIADEVNPIYLPAGYYLVVRWTGATSGDTCTASAQIAVHQLNPALFMSPEDRAQVREAHERQPQHELVEVATAHRRAV